jgi:hypothetical protein
VLSPSFCHSLRLVRRVWATPKPQDAHCRTLRAPCYTLMHSGSPSDALTAVQLCARSRKAAALLLVVQERHQHGLHRCNAIRFLQAMESGCETQGAFEIISIERRRIAVRRERPLPQVWVCVGQRPHQIRHQMLPPKLNTYQNPTPAKFRRRFRSRVSKQSHKHWASAHCCASGAGVDICGAL